MGRYSRYILLLVSIMCFLPCIATAEGVSLEKELQEQFKTSRTVIDKIQIKLGVGSAIESDLNQLKNLSEDIRVNHLLLKERFNARNERVATLGPNAIERHEQMTGRYIEVIEEYLGLIDDLDTEGTVSFSTLNSLKSLLDSVIPKKRAPIFGSLPYRNLNYAAKEPVLEPVIIPAYKGGDKTVTDADLADTPSAPISVEIAELAESLEWNPVRIYEWVKNNIKTQWYYGIMKGAEETLKQKSGNDADQAALLAALLRSAGFPSRYVRGAIEFFPDIERAKHLTGIGNENELASFFQKAGIPCKPIISGGRISNIQIEHIWVETFVPYSNYRGAIIDEHGKTWIALDTSIKVAGYIYNEPEEIPQDFPLSSIRDNYLGSVHDETPLDFLREEIENYLDLNQPDTTYNDLLKTKTPVPEEMNILPAGLQFSQIAITNEYTDLPEELIHKARFRTIDLNSNNNLFDITLELYKLSSKEIIITYEPETVEDQEIINSYGGLSNTPSYLVRVRPVLNVDDARLAIGGDGLPMGADFGLTLDLISPNGSEQVTNTHIIGNITAMTIVAQDVIMPDELPDEEKDAARLLHEESLRYIDRWNRSEDELASLLNVVTARPIPTVVTLGGVMDVTYLLDTPHSMEWKGIFVDADMRAIEVLSGGPDQGEGNKSIFMQLSSMEGSYLESAVPEDDFGVESISTAKLIGLANESGIPIITISSENIAAILPTLSFADNIKEDITNSVNQGLIIEIPQTEIVYEDWTGIGYIKENTETGESGWMLSGVIAGAMTVWIPDRWPEYEGNLLSNPFAEPPNYDPMSGRYIQKITATDMQKGIVGEPLTRPLQVFVRDEDNKPVSGAMVTFTVKAGGGKFLDGSNTIDIPTDINGIASADFILGKKTSDNPMLWWEDGYTYSQQVGQNIVDAALPSGRTVTSPFASFGFPGEPVVMKKIYGDGKYNPILSFAGYVKITIEDQYGNPISNLPINFETLPAIDNSSCTNPNQDMRPALIIGSDDACMGTTPTYGGCSTGATSMQEITSSKGASVHLLMGGTPEGDYPVLATSEGLSQTFHLYTYDFGNCSGTSDPSVSFWGSYSYQTDEYGNNINAGLAGSTIPVKFRMYFLKEGEEVINYNFTCSGEPRVCTKIVGSRQYSEVTEFESGTVTFNGQEGTFQGNGIYTGTYTLQPGENMVDVQADASINIRRSITSCSQCSIIDPYPVIENLGTYMSFTGVEIQTEPEVIVPINDEGRTTCEVAIKYSIVPADYNAATAYVVIYKDGDIIENMISETQGEGFGTLARSYPFDPESTYEAEVVLNYGTGIEMRSDRVALNAGDIMVTNIHLEDEESNVPPGEIVKAVGVTLPENRTLIWSIEGKDDGVIAEIDSETGAIKADEDTESGYITVRATDSEVVCVFKESKIWVGCLCEDCESSGSGTCKLSSVDFNVSLGKSKNGQLAGSLFIKADRPSAILSTPEGLKISTIAMGVDERYDEDDLLRQVVTQQSFVDILVNDVFSYDIRFFRPEDIAGESDGLYEIIPGATPQVIWRIENPARLGTNINRLKLTEIKGGQEKVNEYIWNEDIDEWSLSTGNGLKIETKVEVLDEDLGNRIVTYTVKDSTGNIASITKTTYHKFPWGEEVIEEVNDPTGAALTTSTEYYENPDEVGSYGKIKSQAYPTGSIVEYEYDELGRKTLKSQPWLNFASVRTTSYSYEPVDPSDDQTTMYSRQPRTVTERIQGTVTSRTYYAYIIDNQGERTEIVERCATPSSPYGDPANIRTVTTYYPSGTDSAESGNVKSVLSDDGRLDTYTYEYGTYTPGVGPVPGNFNAGSGDHLRQTVTHGTSIQPAGIPYKTTREISVSDEVGNSLLSESYVYDGSTYNPVIWSISYYDDSDRLTDTYNSDGTHSESIWGCCDIDSEIDTGGINTSYTYDDLGRREMETKEGVLSQSDIMTYYSYDAMGRQLTRTISAGGLSLDSSYEYDSAGRLKLRNDIAGLKTEYDYSQGGLIAKATDPGGSTEIVEKYIDGRTKSITGTGVVHQYYSFGVNTDGTQWIRVNNGSLTSPMWEKTTTDMLGRTVRIEKPGFTGLEITENVYGDQGRLIMTATSGEANTLYLYDELGNLIRSGLDIDASDELEPASMDRITDTNIFYTYIDSNWWKETNKKVYTTANDATATTLSAQRIKLTGLGTGGLVSEMLSIGIHGNETRSTVTIDRDNKIVTEMTDYPDSTIDEISVTENGLLASSKSKSGVMLTYSYDSLGRRTGVSDPRTGINVTHYNDKGQVDWVEDAAGNRTLFTYDPNTGQKIAEENALNKFTRYAYDNLGQIIHTWGDTAYPVEYAYDTYGRIKEMHTFRSGTGWDGITWPEGTTGNADVTKWHYQEATGLLTEKEDADSKSVTYTYTTGGKLETRIWARLDGADPLVTTYVYDLNTGELTDIDYSDNTPDVGFAYDRLGRETTITDAVGSRTFAYNPTNLQLETETISGLYNKVFTRTYDTVDVRGRNTGFNTGADYSVTYGYDADTGRFETVGWNVDGVTDIATYNYVPDSYLLQSMTTDSGLTTAYSYEPNRNLKTSVQNSYNVNLISQYDYQYDPIGRRTSVKNSGQAFTQAAFNIFNYNDRGELNGSNRYIGTDINDTSNPVVEEYRSYNYDSIGNRTSSTDWDPFAAVQAQITYTPNPLNQYSQIITDKGTPVNDNPIYDEDGNMISAALGGAVRTLTYNAENRLIAIEPQTPAEGDTKVEMIYDYRGRRVQKKVYSFMTGTWSLTTHKLFVYDGWEMIKELDGTSGTEKSFVYGLDIKQSLQDDDTGGVGGLLVVVESGAVYNYLYDANGNVGQLVDISDGSITAHYEYDPFGNEIVNVGSMAVENVYRFSTKYLDTEIGLYYYGYRYYSTNLGRWINRDPIGERGGLNIYVFADNEPIGFIDLLGLACSRNWDDLDVLEILCEDCEGQKAVKIMSTYYVVAVEPQEIEYQDWTDRTQQKKVGRKKTAPSAGYHNRENREIGIDMTLSNIDAAATVIHETIHAKQHNKMEEEILINPNAIPMTRYAKEKEAWEGAEQWRLDRTFPAGDPSFRTKDKNGNEILDLNAIDAVVHRRYGVDKKGGDYFREILKKTPPNPSKIWVWPWDCDLVN